MLITSIDIGFKGGIAIFELNNNTYSLASFFPMPITTHTKNKKQTLDITTIHSILSPASIIVIENTHTFPHDGRVSAFNFGYQKGVIYAISVLVAGEKNTHLIAPQSWKKYYNLTKLPRQTQKQKAIELANNLFNLNLAKTQDGIADAILLGKYFIEKHLLKST